ncbi:MAG: crossover junction endodeoxyribonuclease RuvC [Actinobacteria bacterium]|nr:crossover junction endodeoxyribonuclease RuvC [Actinomycetota bacterium]
MRVIGIDPGLTRLGYGIVEEKKGSLTAISFGTLRGEGSDAGAKLVALRTRLAELMAKHRPDVAAVERLFVNKNRRTATHVGRASGVAMMALSEHGLAVTEYGPMEVKMSLTGYGNATKEQVGYMVKSLLRLQSDPDSPDAADALAVAICHVHSRRLKEAAFT